SEQIAGTKKVQRQPRAVGGPGLDPNLAATHPEQRIAAISFLEQHLASGELLRVAKPGNALQFGGAEVCKQRIHFENDSEFSRFAHRNIALTSLAELTGRVSVSQVTQVCSFFALFMRW